MSEIRFDGKVAVVTGAGAGLGRAHALLLASRGAKVVVNDLGGNRQGVGNSFRPADYVVREIREAGGIAVPDYNSVIDGEKVVKTALDNFGRIDILINNAGILRDKSFPRISKEDWDIVLGVHLNGTFAVTQAAFPIFKKQGYGRIVMTSSSSGLYGNFGQANYASAKMGVVGLSNTVAIEGAKYNVHCNVIVPVAASRLTEDVFGPDYFKELKPELVSPVVAYLCHDSCTANGTIIDTALGWAAKIDLVQAEGAFMRKNATDPVTIENVRDNWEKIVDMRITKRFSSGKDTSLHTKNILKRLQQGDASVSGKTFEHAFTKKDAVLYALSVGASVERAEELKFIYEKHDDFTLLPSFFIQPGLIALFNSQIVKTAIPGKPATYKNNLHAEHYFEVVGDTPQEGKLYSTAKLAEVLDKGKAGLIVNDVDTFNEQHELVARNQVIMFALGCGNFGGPKNGNKAVPSIPKPKRNPDVSVSYTTLVDQAAFFRLLGDQNPLHIDPNVAKSFGFEKSILHGLCTLGISVRIVLQTFAGYDSSLFKAVKARFTKPVLPGQTLRVDMWQEGKRIHFETVVVDNNTVAITGAYVDLKNVKKNPHAKL